ncbi:MAG: hypothetical protein ACR2HF_15045 [Methylococcaceae bacterium]
MELSKSPLWLDLKKIFDSPTGVSRYEYVATVHTPAEDFPVTQVVQIDCIRDYQNQIGDQIFADFILPMGDYAKRLYPHRVNLEMTLTRKPLYAVGGGKNKEAENEVERYKAIFLPNENQHVQGSDLTQYDKPSLDLADVITVRLQLMNRCLEPLRIKSVGGVYKKVTAKDLLQTLLVTESQKVLVDGKPAIDGMDLIEPNNPDSKAHVVVPHGTLIPAIPTYIQEKLYGVYNAGIGTYLQSYQQKRLWFVYPLYDTTRFINDKKTKVIFYAVPEKDYPILEMTYRLNGDILYVMAQDKKRYLDMAETDQVSQGIGFRQADARAFMKKPIEVKKEGPEAVRNQLVCEVINKSRDDGLNFAPISDQRISSNPFIQYSAVAAREGGRVDLTWYYADPSLLFPGMACQYVYLDGEEIMRLNGVILKVYASVQLDGIGVGAHKHMTHCHLSIFTEKHPPVENTYPPTSTAFA